VAIIAEAKQYKEFELPAEGTVQAVLAEVIDKGIEDVIWKGVAKKVHKVSLRWQLAELDAEKQPKRVYEKFTLSLDPKAKLYARIKGLFGKEPPASLDLEKIVGTNTNLVIVHNAGTDKQGKAKTYANIAATLKLQPGQAKLAIVPIPKKDEVKAEVAKSLAVTEANPITDDDIPF
jgi:hypothetical protein